jgi:hypothetical protein
MKWKVILLYLSISFSTLAQNNFKPGYIVQQSGDTLTGFIESFIEASGRRCSFKVVMDAEAQHYSASEIQGYGVSNVEHFRSLPLSPNELIFAEVIIDGKASLLAVEDYFFIQKENSFVSLQPKSKIIYVKETTYRREDRSSFQQLHNVLSDCKASLELERLQLYDRSTEVQEKALTKIVDKYNACVGSGSRKMRADETKHYKTVYYLSAYGGPSWTTTSIATETLFAGAKNDGDLGFIGGIRGTLGFSAKSPAAIELGLAMQSVSVNVTGESNAHTRVLTAKYNTIKIPVGISYRFFIKNYQPYFGAGGSASFLLGDGIMKLDGQEQFHLPSHIFGFYVSAGVARKINSSTLIFIESTYDDFSPIVNVESITLKTEYLSASVGVRYRLTKAE